MKHLSFCSCSTCFTALIHVVICLSASFECTEGFDSQLELPHSGSNRTRPTSKRIIFVGDFGAKGDGVNDDTQVTYLQLICYSVFFFLCCGDNVSARLFEFELGH